jgi:GNAT superfamily N-acetyltransferase
MFNESPDFNYSMFHNRDKELKNVKFNCVVTRNSGGGTYLEVMAMLDLEQIGYIHILYDKTAFNYSIGMVRRSDIEYEWKGTGLGQMLYDKAIHYAKEKGCKYLWSDTERSVNAENAWKRLSKRYPITFVTSKSGMKYYQVDLDKI